MSSLSRALASFGLVALAGSSFVSDASAFGGGFGGRPSLAMARPIGGHVPSFGGPGLRGPIFGGPVRLPPIGRLPRPIPIRFPRPPRPWPWHPGPHLPPIVIWHHPHHWPIVPVGFAAPVAVGASVAAIHAEATAPCGVTGTFVSIVFVPTVTVTDITAFLKTYAVTMADGPDKDGTYRIRLSDGLLPADRVAEILAAMRAQTLIVSSVDGV